MTTLALRATPRQRMVLRIVHGAVRNAAHAHPRWPIDPRMASSIAKRAAGTLIATWPSVLAASQAPSVGPAHGERGPTQGGDDLLRRPKGRGAHSGGIPPAVFVVLGRQALLARYSGQDALLGDLVEVLRLLAMVKTA